VYILLTQGTKRCHDIGKNGWYQLIPLYGFYLIFAEGHFGENQYGPNPKGIGNEEANDALIESIGQ
jgi:uncharacterized membrane protein YhaH (DUF805 family)